LLSYLSGPARKSLPCAICSLGQERNKHPARKTESIISRRLSLLRGYNRNIEEFSKYIGNDETPTNWWATTKISAESYYCRTNNSWGGGARRPTMHLDCMFLYRDRNSIITSMIGQCKSKWDGPPDYTLHGFDLDEERWQTEWKDMGMFNPKTREVKPSYIWGGKSFGGDLRFVSKDAPENVKLFIRKANRLHAANVINIHYYPGGYHN